MKILVFGGTGMAGHVISQYLSENEYEVTTFGRRESSGLRTIIGDVMNATDIEQAFNQKFDVVVNCVGILNQECERVVKDAIYINSYFPHFLSDLCKRNNAKLIHLSTDCVFSGKIGRYTEDSLKDGDTLYDITKSLGEVFEGNCLTLRQSIIGPDLNSNGIGLFNWFMKQEGTIIGFKNAIWTGVSTITLAKAIDAAIKADLKGVYHLVNNETISKFDLLELFNKHFKNNSIIITENIDRVIDKSLINTRGDFNFSVPSYEDMIVEIKEWILNHDNYPHYKILC